MATPAKELGQLDDEHAANESPLTVINCDFHNVGCDVKLPRKDMPIHLKENLVTHLSLQAASHNKLAAIVTELKGENQALRQMIADQLHTPTLTPGYVEFTMSRYEKHKLDGDHWYSPPFYTHLQGYKMCLRVNANGNGNVTGTHISVYVHLMKGEFDDHLKWPFRGDITVQLVNHDRKENEQPYFKTADFNDKTANDIAGRVMEGERNFYGWGYPEYISHDQLQGKYLKNDSLCFRITKVKLN